MFNRVSALKTLIINLESSLDRRERILALTAEMPFLDIQLIKAVNGETLGEEQRRTFIHPNYMRFTRTLGMTNGELGCALSHRKCYDFILANHFEYALILEDDVLIGDGFNDAVEMASQFLASVSKPTAILLSARTVCKTVPIKKNKGLEIRVAYSGVGTYGYILNNAGATLLLEKSLPFRYPADYWFRFREMGLKLYAVVPHVTSFSSDRSDSSIHSERQKMWNQYTAFRSQHGSWMEKHFPQITYQRICIKFYKLFFGARECEKTWPED